MPFKSEKQRRYLYANEPKLAKKWSNMYGDKIVGLGNVKKGKSYALKTTKGRPVLIIVGESPKGIVEKAIYKKEGFYISSQLGFNGLLTAYFKNNKILKKIVDKKYHKQLKEQGYKDREDESLGMRRGAERGKKQSYKDRRNESYGKFGKRDKEKKGRNKINKKISGLGGISTDEYLMKIAATLLAKGLNPSRYAKYKAKAYLKDVKAKEKVYELIDKKSADIVIYMKRIKNL